jgi:hypothetical protein
VTLWLCVAPLRLGGLRGKKSTPSVWLGGTGELIEVGKQEQERINFNLVFPFFYLVTNLCRDP